MHSSSSFRALIALALLVPVLSGCSTKDSEPAVATVSLTLNKTRVPLDAPIEFTYRFDVAPGAKIPPGYRVFVHVNSADGKMLWADDHEPPVPTAEWKPGQTVQYTRLRFIPVVPYVGDATIQVGMYKDNAPRLPLQGSDATAARTKDRGYKVASLQLLPQSDSVAVTYKDGWHGLEYAPGGDQSDSWQWSQKVATLEIQNPKADVTMMLQYDARPDAFPGQQQHVTVYSGQQAVNTFVADASAPAMQRIPITAAQLGTADTTSIRLEMDRSFVPANLPVSTPDTRELGIRVYHVYFERR
jgi:hypothetical protein